MGIMIALPCHGGIVNEKTTMSLFNLGKLLVRNNIPHGLLTQANSSLITHGRSKCANFFINNTDHEYLFFLDSDIGFNPCLLYTSPSPRDQRGSRMPSSA